MLSAARSACLPLALALAVGGCASRSVDVAPVPVDPQAFSSWDCERLHAEDDEVQARALHLAYAVDARFGDNLIALGAGLGVFWPVLLGLRPQGPEAAQLAELKGRHEALQAAIAARRCPPPAATLTAEQAAALPIALGERLLYVEREGGAATDRRLGLRLSGLGRDGLEFIADIDGRPQPRPWVQDRAGNSGEDASAGPVQWRRLLRPGLKPGDVLAGELRLGGEGAGWGPVRGRVMAAGPQTVSGRHFDAAVIELSGEVPQARSYGSGGVRNAGVDGVLVVDRTSGVLLRIELGTSSARTAFRRRLVQVEPAAQTLAAPPR